MKKNSSTVRLTVIVVSYNTQKVLARCLASLNSGLGTWAAKTKLVVVDNGSTDGSAKWLARFVREKRPFQTEVLSQKTNLGFGRAVDLGFGRAEGDWLLLLNSDIVCHPRAIEKLIDYAREQKRLGVVGGRLLNLDQTPQASVYHLPTAIGAIREFWLGQTGAFLKYLPAKSGEVEAVVGAVMLLPMAVVRDQGLFEEKYFMYFEDLDLCRRYRRSGLKVYYCTQAEFVHYHGESARKEPGKTRHYLVESSRCYYGSGKKVLIDLIIWTGQKWQKIKQNTGH